MRNLDSINPGFAKPASMASVCAFLPLIMCCIAVVLIDGAARELPFSSNPLSLFFSAIAILSLFMTIVPRILKWNWDARYFGVSALYIGSVAILGGVPWLCFLCFGAQPLAIRLIFFLAYSALLFRWCRQFFVYYQRLYADEGMRAWIYEVDNDGAFYMQKGDKALFERLKFRQSPSDLLFLVCMAAGVISIPFIKPLKEIIGLPFVHIFLGISSIPIDMLALGQVARAWLIFYHYPSKIKQASGYRVCVDMGTKPSGSRGIVLRNGTGHTRQIGGIK